MTKLNEILLDDNPDLARKMGIIPSEQNEMTQFGVGTMGQEEEEDGKQQEAEEQGEVHG